MTVRKILVAHPDREMREQIEARLGSMEVVSVSSTTQIVDGFDHTFDGLILSCCFGTSEQDGLALATLYREHQIGTFDGFILGLACNEQCTRDFDSRRITSGDAVFVGRVMVHEMIQLESEVQAQDVAV